jgi:hypothetical protein
MARTFEDRCRGIARLRVAHVAFGDGEFDLDPTLHTFDCAPRGYVGGPASIVSSRTAYIARSVHPGILQAPVIREFLLQLRNLQRVGSGDLRLFQQRIGMLKRTGSDQRGGRSSNALAQSPRCAAPRTVAHEHGA